MEMSEKKLNLMKFTPYHLAIHLACNQDYHTYCCFTSYYQIILFKFDDVPRGNYLKKN